MRQNDTVIATRDIGGLLDGPHVPRGTQGVITEVSYGFLGGNTYTVVFHTPGGWLSSGERIVHTGLTADDIQRA